MPGTPKVPTYEELREQRAQEWASAQARAAADLRALQAALAKMPDVANAPRQDLPWSSPGIKCPHCSSEGFLVVRWVTVNGKRHRTELKCLGCHVCTTWDWNESRWLIGK